MKKLISSLLATLIMLGSITCSAASYGLNKPATVGRVSITMTSCKDLGAYAKKFDYGLLSITIKNDSAKPYTFSKTYVALTGKFEYDVPSFRDLDFLKSRVQVAPKSKKSITIKFIFLRTLKKVSFDYSFLNYNNEYLSDLKAIIAHKMTSKEFRNKYKLVELYFTIPVTK